MSVFRDLADYIDEIYPNRNRTVHSEDAAFVKIFRELLTADEACWAMKLTAQFVTPSQLAAQTNSPQLHAQKYLRQLSIKGILYEENKDGEWRYRLSPYFPGIVEALMSKNINESIAGYLQEYMDELAAERVSENKNHRIQLNQVIRTETYRLSREEIELYLDQTESYSLTDCLCRLVNKMNGKDCGHSIKDMCIQTGSYAEYYIRTGRARRADRKEIENILQYANEQGLYFEIFPVDDTRKNAFICNCCSCGCLFLQLSGRIQQFSGTGFGIEIEPLLCTDCRSCLRQCPSEAIGWNRKEGRLSVDPSLCFDCGLCLLLCPVQAIRRKT
ncbi:ferredoxin family protein [Acetobacterium wieringae]|uniref:Ferredoxin family protein n=1 Tax=Acetobacterium wieringae TaxID=52694 RepID=A0ABY6HLQ8_9FIRM|nr:ferredoxin family protein [Acetobacterium wieringae]UYO64354.1 ferredoxin family protein [Acetobacterium wieringae]VUZ27131.1 Uncharacterised protein [Acetobacterium wieringae]